MSEAAPVTMPQAAPEPLWGEVVAPKHEPNRTAWLLTCVDLTSLLVGFFVLLFSTQTLKRDKWEAVSGSFQSQFAANDRLVVPVVPDGGDNAVVRVTSMKSGLAYLDTLLHQRMAQDAVWRTLVAENSRSGGPDMTYAVPEGVRNMAIPETGAAWVRLGNAVRGWKNPVGVRVSAPKAEIGAAAAQAVAMAAKLADGGANGVFAEVRVSNARQVQVVVR